MVFLEARRRRHDARVNYAIFFADSFGYPLAFSIISVTTIMPLLLTKLGASNLVVGLLPALSALGAYIPGLLSATRLERVPIKKRVLVTLGMIERLFILAMALGVMLWATRKPSAAIGWFLVFWTLANVMTGLVLPAYLSMLAKCIPPEERGGLIGWSGALAGVLGVFAAELAGVILTRVAFPNNFAILFVVAFIILSATILPFSFTREPADPTPEECRSVWQYARDALVNVRSNSSYRWAIVALAVMSFALTAASFYSTYAVRHFEAGPREVARYAGLIVGASVFALPLLGKIGDRHGHRLSLAITAASFACAAALALVSTSANGIYPVLILASIGTSGIAVSQNLILAEFAPSHADVPMYTSVSLLLLAPIRAAAPVVAGWMSDVWGFPVMFWVALIAGIASLAIMWFAVAEPRHTF
ncbi:MAG: MFS transporter [Clostridia bacterium]|nr:MFS transporter [Clostridia bacterium]